jgi:hypothetical protein
MVASEGDKRGVGECAQMTTGGFRYPAQRMDSLLGGSGHEADATTTREPRPQTIPVSCLLPGLI